MFLPSLHHIGWVRGRCGLGGCRATPPARFAGGRRSVLGGAAWCDGGGKRVFFKTSVSLKNREELAASQMDRVARSVPQKQNRGKEDRRMKQRKEPRKRAWA